MWRWRRRRAECEFYTRITNLILPPLKCGSPDGETIVEEWWNFVMPDEYFTQSYIMPAEFIGEGKFSDITELRIVGGKSRNYYYTITDITVVDRPMGK